MTLLIESEDERRAALREKERNSQPFVALYDKKSYSIPVELVI